jgi:hypothetical protein
MARSPLIDRFGHFADQPAANVTQCAQNDFILRTPQQVQK